MLQSGRWLGLGVWAWSTIGAVAISAEGLRLVQAPVLRPPLNAPNEAPPAIVESEPRHTVETLPVPLVPQPLFTPPPSEEQDTPLAPPSVYRVSHDAPPALSDTLPQAALAQTSTGKLIPVTYRHWGRKKGKDCAPLVPQWLCVVHPCTDCTVRVPVCVPVGCLECEPKVHARKALLSDSLVSFEWERGIKIVVRFERAGTVTVTYHGL